MKYTTAVALLPFAASAVNVDKRQERDEKFELTDFAAKCYEEQGDYCVYQINISSSTEPEFKQGCDVTETSSDGSLPEVQQHQCGTFKISVTKSDDGGLILEAELRSERLIGEHKLSKDDLETGEDGREEYTGDKDFSIDASTGRGGPITSTGSEPSGTASETGTASESTGTETEGADSDNSEGDDDGEDDGAVRVGAFTGILVAVGVMAYMF